MKQVIFMLFFLMLQVTNLIGQGWVRERFVNSNPFIKAVSDICLISDNGLVVTGTGSNGAFLYKLNESGDSIWQKNYSHMFQSLSVKETNDNGLVMCGVNSSATDFLIQKTNSIGDTLWTTEFDFFQDDKAFEIQETADSGFIVAGLTSATNGASSLGSKAALLKLDKFGNVEWSNEYCRYFCSERNDFQYVEQTSDGGYIATGRGYDSGENIWIVKTNSIGTIEWDTIYGGEYGSCVRELDSGNFAVWGGDWNKFYLLSPTGAQLHSRSLQGSALSFNSSNFPWLLNKVFVSEITPDNGFVTATRNWSNNKILLSKLDSVGNTTWTQNIEEVIGSNLYPVKVIQGDPKFFYVLCGKIKPNNSLYAQVIKIDTNGIIYDNNLLVQTYVDLNNNCVVDQPDTVTVLGQLELFKNNIKYYSASNSPNFIYSNLDTGTYEVVLLPENEYWEVCQDTQQTTIDGVLSIDTLDFSVEPLISCPLMEVSISAPLLRRCFDNNYYVHYCNKGTITGSNAYVEIELDNFLAYNSSSTPLASQVGNIYRFNLGDIASNNCGSFSINVSVSCNATLGQIHCTKAHIYPDSLCLISIPNINITDTCIADSVQFTVTNNADNFPFPIAYWVLGNTTIVDTGSMQLNYGQSMTITYPLDTNISVYQLLVDPSYSQLFNVSQQVICNPLAINTIQTLVPLNNDLRYNHTDCQANIGSYDPNDKQAIPVGSGLDHNILPNTPLEYKIRFQNTGTDTAFTVKIIDTLSSFLDPSSIEVGAASHNVSWQVSGQGIIEFTFDNIQLPDSNVNEAASHGFIKFSIKQAADLPNGILIENNAAIYFDFNAPVITNTAFHTICENCLPLNIGSLITHNKGFVNQEDVSVQIMPNPFREQTTIEVKGGGDETLYLTVYDMLGRNVLTDQSNNNRFEIQGESLSKGVYLFTINTEYKVIYSDKILVK